MTDTTPTRRDMDLAAVLIDRAMDSHFLPNSAQSASFAIDVISQASDSLPVNYHSVAHQDALALILLRGAKVTFLGRPLEQESDIEMALRRSGRLEA